MSCFEGSIEQNIKWKHQPQHGYQGDRGLHGGEEHIMEEDLHVSAAEAGGPLPPRYVRRPYL